MFVLGVVLCLHYNMTPKPCILISGRMPRNKPEVVQLSNAALPRIGGGKLRRLADETVPFSEDDTPGSFPGCLQR